jgi:hypothetical protein
VQETVPDTATALSLPACTTGLKVLLAQHLFFLPMRPLLTSNSGSLISSTSDRYCQRSAVSVHSPLHSSTFQPVRSTRFRYRGKAFGLRLVHPSWRRRDHLCPGKDAGPRRAGRGPDADDACMGHLARTRQLVVRRYRRRYRARTGARWQRVCDEPGVRSRRHRRDGAPAENGLEG